VLDVLPVLADEQPHEDVIAAADQPLARPRRGRKPGTAPRKRAPRKTPTKH
jgi:hypothetical protein